MFRVARLLLTYIEVKFANAQVVAGTIFFFESEIIKAMELILFHKVCNTS